MNEEMPIKVILLDDHLLFRLGLRSALKSSNTPISIVGEAGTATAFFDLIKNVQADLVLLDIVLPDFSGVEVARRLRAEKSDLKILVLSAETDVYVITQFMELGVNGFINKNVPVKELCTAIQYVMEGSEYFGRDISCIMHDVRIAKNLAAVQFTDREKEVLELCARGYSAKEIAISLNIGLKTIEAHKSHIFKKLGINNSIELVHYALKSGIISL